VIVLGFHQFLLFGGFYTGVSVSEPKRR